MYRLIPVLLYKCACPVSVVVSCDVLCTYVRVFCSSSGLNVILDFINSVIMYVSVRFGGMIRCSCADADGMKSFSTERVRYAGRKLCMSIKR